MKDHGTERKIDGNFKPGTKLVLIDDVTTKGGSVVQAVPAPTPPRAKLPRASPPQAKPEAKPPRRPGAAPCARSSLKAADTLGSACPAETALTPVGRMDAMRKRLAAVRAATAAIRPALVHFYEALDQGQKVRFAGMS